jgi:hypothetical protein
MDLLSIKFRMLLLIFSFGFLAMYRLQSCDSGSRSLHNHSLFYFLMLAKGFNASALVLMGGVLP